MRGGLMNLSGTNNVSEFKRKQQSLKKLEATVENMKKRGFTSKGQFKSAIIAVANARKELMTNRMRAAANKVAQANAAAKAQANAAAKAQANAANAAAATAQAAANAAAAAAQASANASAAAEEVAEAEKPGIFKTLTNTAKAALTGNPTPTVAASNAIAAKSEKLAELANRANALAANIRAMVGGKRNRRTRRK